MILEILHGIMWGILGSCVMLSVVFIVFLYKIEKKGVFKTDKWIYTRTKREDSVR